MSHRTLIDVETLKAHLADPHWVLLDCRFNLGDPAAGQAAYDRGHIPGARYAHLDRDLASPITPASGRHPLPEPSELARTLGRWGIDHRTQVVVYDDAGGALAGRAWWLLRWLGHDRVALLDGGLPAWQAAGGELSSAVPQPRKRAFTARLRPDWVVSSDQVLENLDRPGFVLVDARTPERFRGEQEPIDPVAGAVPGALNRPLGQNLTEGGRFKSAAQLATEWRALLGERPATEVVAMCGSGVTACHLLLALEHAGLAGARLYAGSWSEWIRDPARPLR